MARREDEPYAVTVTMTATERQMVVALVDAMGMDSMMQLMRMLLWSAADDYGLAPGDGTFERRDWGRLARPRTEDVSVPTPARVKRDGRRVDTRQPAAHPWRATVGTRAERGR
jgi:hypothetical protein